MLYLSTLLIEEKDIEKLINLIFKNNILSKNGIIILHRHKKDDIKITSKLNIIDKRFYGVSKIIFCN